MDWIDVISRVGFPIAAAVALGWFTKNRLDKSEEMSARREESMTGRIRELENRVEDTLVTLVQEQGELIRATKGVLSECNSTMRECAAAMTHITDMRKAGT